MNEDTFITALSGISNTLSQLSLHATEPDDPMAFPEPRSEAEISVFSGQLEVLRSQSPESHHSLLTTTLRDYKAGYSDRCGAYLVEFIEKLQAEPSYAQGISTDGQSKVNFYLIDLREL